LVSLRRGRKIEMKASDRYLAVEGVRSRVRVEGVEGIEDIKRGDSRGGSQRISQMIYR
jgi:hypothetical protein